MRKNNACNYSVTLANF